MTVTLAPLPELRALGVDRMFLHKKTRSVTPREMGKQPKMPCYTEAPLSQGALATGNKARIADRAWRASCNLRPRVGSGQRS